MDHTEINNEKCDGMGVRWWCHSANISLVSTLAGSIPNDLATQWAHIGTWSGTDCITKYCLTFILGRANISIEGDPIIIYCPPNDLQVNNKEVGKMLKFAILLQCCMFP